MSSMEKSTEEIPRCSECKGWGEIYELVKKKCEYCDGKGFTYCGYENCVSCQGFSLTCHKCKATGKIDKFVTYVCNKCYHTR